MAVAVVGAQPVIPPVRTTTGARQRAVSSYASLSAQIKAAGLLDRRRGYYVARIVTAVLALASVCAGIVLLGNSWLQLLMAGALAVVLSQCAFLGHDGAHRQMFASFRGNEVAGRLLAGLAAGLSYGWWMGKHSRHHQAPNQRGTDGDIESKVLSFTIPAATSRRGLLAWLTRHQAWLFFPLLLLEGVNLHVDSVSTLTSRSRPIKRRWLDILMIAVHWSTYLTLLLLWLPPGKAAAFVGVHMALFGLYLGGTFTPNHTGMPIVENNAKLDFLSRQVLMSRNILGGRPINFLMGGLNYQIEHHLFPSMPRPNLARAQPIVKAFCREHAIDYTEATLPAAYRTILAYLNHVGLSARQGFTCPLAQQLRGNL
jgi:fatty acid desaturase